nr:oligosaccharide flippase family protein [Bacteroidota bacterium]
GQVVSVIFYVRRYFKGVTQTVRTKFSLKELLKEYKDFPLKSGLSGVLNIVASQLPVFLIGSYFGLTVLGFYALILKVLNLPLSVIGNSVSQVYFQMVTQMIQEKQNIYKFVFNFSKKLLLLISFPLIILFLWSEQIFVFVFGDKWGEAGEITKYFIAFYIIRFVFYSQSTLFTARRKMGIEIRQNLMFLISQLASVFIGHYYFQSYHYTFLLMGISSFLVYLWFMYMLIKISKDTEKGC